MKRRDLIKHLKNNNVTLLRHGGGHDLYINTEKDIQTAIPRHNEIKKFMAREICKQLGVEVPLGN